VFNSGMCGGALKAASAMSDRIRNERRAVPKAKRASSTSRGSITPRHEGSWPMIEAKLRQPERRGTTVPPYRVENVDDAIAGRWKRVRQWGKSEKLIILPWIGLNASGTDLCGVTQPSDDSKTGQVMCKLAHHWGFDGVAAYNLLPLLGSKSEEIVKAAKRCRDQNPEAWRGKIYRNFELISGDLTDADAVILGWGSMGGKPFVRDLATGLFARLDGKSSWAFDVNRRGQVTTPRHPAIRGAFRFEVCDPKSFARSLFV
jgi:hypothetical protein